MKHIDPDDLSEHYKAVRKRIYAAGIHKDTSYRIDPEERKAGELRAEKNRLKAETAKRVAAWASLIEQAKLQGLLEPTLQTLIIKRVAEKHDVSVAAVRGRDRSSLVILARFEVFYCLFDETPMSKAEIGRSIGGRDHSTVLHGIIRHAERCGLPIPRESRL